MGQQDKHERDRQNREELDRFKREVNFVEYASTLEYEVDGNESTKNSVVLRGPGGDKVIVSSGTGGHWIYFSVRDDKDNGTLIDFVQKRTGKKIGEIRLDLRKWMGEADTRPPMAAPKRIEKPVQTEMDRPQIEKQWRLLAPYAHDYLTVERGLSQETIKAFAPWIRQDGWKNACFMHRDRIGVTGWEKKNRKFTGFAEGGDKRLFAALVGDRKENVVIGEAAIDLMSYHQMKGVINTLYISIGGSMSEDQRLLLEEVLRTTPKAKLIVATDNDGPGEKYDAIVRAVRPDAVRDKPERKDWNDDLRASLGMIP